MARRVVAPLACIWRTTGSTLAAKASAAARLAVALRVLGEQRETAGVRVSAKREPKTGRRLIRLAWGDDRGLLGVSVLQPDSASRAAARVR
jgi:hypothetical protein